MSNLNSKFDVYKGWPNGSALELSVYPAVAGITEGKVVALASRSPIGTAAAATQLNPAVTAEIDMFVDPNAAADFVTAVVTDDHVLDVCRNANADMITVLANEHIFLPTYTGAKALRGVVGKKRVRTTDADAFTVARTAQACSYFIRPMILKSEDAASTYLKADANTIVTADNGGGLTRITKAGAFASVLVGDVCAISGGAVAGNNVAAIVTSVGGAPNAIEVNLTYAADANSATAPFQCQVYRPIIAGVTDGTGAAGTGKITKAGAFGSAAIGDMAVVLAGTAAGNIGTWYVSAKTANDITVVGPGATTIVDNIPGDMNVVVFRPKAARGDASVTVRKRITRLYDTGVDFLTPSPVIPGKDEIVMPWPASTDASHWDTTVTRWQISTVVDAHTLDANLDDLEELAPEDFIAPYAANAPYRLDLYDDMAKAAVMTSARCQASDASLNVPDHAWLVVQGNDQFDGYFTNRLALLKVKTGVVFHISSTIANTLVPGDLVYSNSGALAKVANSTAQIGGTGVFHSDYRQPIGLVLESNNTAGALGEITVVGI